MHDYIFQFVLWLHFAVKRNERSGDDIEKGIPILAISEVLIGWNRKFERLKALYITENFDHLYRWPKEIETFHGNLDRVASE